MWRANFLSTIHVADVDDAIYEFHLSDKFEPCVRNRCLPTLGPVRYQGGTDVLVGWRTKCNAAYTNTLRGLRAVLPVPAYVRVSVCPCVRVSVCPCAGTASSL